MPDQIKAVFLAALDTPTDQRSAYLDQACGGDSEVRRRVEALLRAHDEPDRLLDHPAWGPTPEQDWPPTLPELFLEVLDREPAERPAYLDGACGGDTALRRRIEALLRSYIGGGGFLAVPAAEQLAAIKHEAVNAPPDLSFLARRRSPAC
jgi:hypothetical protein